MKFEPGDLVLLPFPFTDLSSSKTRPALVLSGAPYNAASADVIVCAVTSNLSDAAHTVLIDTNDLARGSLPKPSRIRADKIATLEKTLVRRIFARVRPETLRRVLLELRAVLASAYAD